MLLIPFEICCAELPSLQVQVARQKWLCKIILHFKANTHECEEALPVQISMVYCWAVQTATVGFQAQTHLEPAGSTEIKEHRIALRSFLFSLLG